MPPTPIPPRKTDDSEGTPERPEKTLRVPRGGPTPTEKKHLRVLLLSLRDKIIRSNADLAEEALKGSGQDYKVDHLADFGSDNAEQDVSLSLLEGETALLQAVDLAIRKIDGQEDLPFGLCKQCAEQEGEFDPESPAPWIPTGRLEIVPYARLCVPHQEEQEEG